MRWLLNDRGSMSKLSFTLCHYKLEEKEREREGEIEYQCPFWRGWRHELQVVFLFLCPVFRGRDRTQCHQKRITWPLLSLASSLSITKVIVDPSPGIQDTGVSSPVNDDSSIADNGHSKSIRAQEHKSTRTQIQLHHLSQDL